MNKAVFLDRDGVINKYNKPINQPQDLELYSWTSAAIKRLNDAHYKTFIVTNQGGIECGYFTETELENIHLHLINLLNETGATIDEIAYCPHFKSECNYRKPNPGMILKLAEKYTINLHSSYLIGDRKSDIIAGKKADCITIKIGAKCPDADYSVETLEDAVDIILC